MASASHNSTEPRLPNFMIGGASKCGTTSLAYYLDEHPEIAISRPKETHFFDTDELHKQGMERYAQFFAHATNEPCVGDATPAYLHGTEIAHRIHDAFPDLKLVFIFRDPVKRAYSNYWHGYRAGRPIGSFVECIDDPDCRHVWERSRYAKYLKTFVDLFGMERIHIVITEQLSKEPQHVLSGVYRFLGVDESFQSQRSGKRLNTHSMPRSIAVQRLIYKHFHPGIKAEEITHYDEQGRMDVRRTGTVRFRQLKRGVGFVNRKLNHKQGKYPPMQEADALKVKELFEDDNQAFVDLTGIDIHKWWTYV